MQEADALRSKLEGAFEKEEWACKVSSGTWWASLGKLSCQVSNAVAYFFGRCGSQRGAPLVGSSWLNMNGNFLIL